MLNLDSLKEVVGNDSSMMSDLLAQFLETTQQDMRQLQDAVAATNAKDIVNLAHRIKGSCFVIGARAMADIMGELEKRRGMIAKAILPDLCAGYRGVCQHP